MNHAELEELRKRYKHAEELRKNIDNTAGLLDAIRRRMGKGSSPYQLGLNRKVDNYNSQVYLTVPESVIAAMIPGIKKVLADMRVEFKSLDGTK